METPITTTPAQLAAAFTEWERQYREDPSRFTPAAEVAATSVETYGESSARTLLALLAEQASE